MIKISGPGAAHVNHSMFGARGPTMAKEDEGGGGGGDDAAAADAAFEAKFNALFHKASTAREKRFKTELVKEMSTVLDTSVGTRFDELRKLIVEGDGERQEQRGEPNKMSAEAEAMIRQAQKDAKEAKDAATKWQSEATAEKQKALKNEERQELREQLSGKVKPALLEMVVDQLHAKHLMRDPETGRILWKDEDDQTLPLKDAVAAWAKSDVGKEFTPPRDARGTGSRGGREPEDNAARIPGTMNAEKLGDIVLGSIPGQR